MTRTSKKTTDAVEILRRRFVESDEEMAALVRQERQNAAVAQQIYDLRTAAKLTQQELADLVGTTASVVCRLEDADYEGHSLNVLHRIAAALGRRVEVHFIPIKGVPTPKDSAKTTRPTKGRKNVGKVRVEKVAERQP